jgi:hypothetical protein
VTHAADPRADAYIDALPDWQQGIRDFLVSTYRYTLRVEAYVGFITDRYPPFTLAA